MNWVWNHSRSRHGARLVLLAIADRARENGSAWPSVKDLKRMTGLGERAVQGAIIDCEKLGELEVGYQLGPKGCNLYRVLMTPADSAGAQEMRGADSAPPQDVRGSESSQVKGLDPADTAPPAESAPPQISTGPPAESADEPLKEPSTKNSPTESSPAESADGALFAAPAAEKPKKRGRRTKPTDDPAFDEWYAAYPLHKDRGDAEKAWPDALATGVSVEVLVDAARRYHHDPKVLLGYIKSPARWLRAKCWLDEDAPAPLAVANGHDARSKAEADRLERQLARAAAREAQM